MPIATAQGRENAAAGYVSTITHASLHTADPGTTGANELTGGTPAYARLAITWNAGTVDGVYTGTVSARFNVPANTTITHVGVWTAATGGSFVDKAALSVYFTAASTLEISQIVYTQS